MMSCFDYPLDEAYLLSKKRRILKEIQKNINTVTVKRIAVLGGSTTNEVVDQINLFLLQHGIRCEFYTSEYGKYWEDAMFPPKNLIEFHPDFVYIHTNWRNIDEFPSLTDSIEIIEDLLDRQYSKFEQIWESIFEKFNCIIIQNNFERPDYRLFGNRDVWDPHGRLNFISRLNLRIYDYAKEHENFYINDIEYLSSDFGLTKWNDPTYWYMYKYAMHIQAIPHVAKSVSDIIKSILGKNKKLLALDLDNTLWGGIIGDDGIEGIQLGPELPSGQAYLDFQKYCKLLLQIGILLAINSKNEESNALLGLKHPNSALKADDFVSIKANWDSKDQNLRKIAEELDLGIESFVFLDDNPAERNIVSVQLQEVYVPEIEKVEQFIQMLDHCGYFEVTTFSTEDQKKTELYHAKIEAKKQSSTYSDYGEYLDSLDMVADVKPFDALVVQRIAQLTNKSNQFNLTTLRCTEADVRRMVDDIKWITLYGRLSDKFVQHGVVSVLAGEIENQKLHMRLWLMSCRVLKRDLEYLMIDELVKYAKNEGIEEIIGYYYPSAKNAMVKDFYGAIGFVKIDENNDGNTVWSLNTQTYLPQNKHIRMENYNG